MSFKIVVTIGDTLISNPEKLKKIDSYGDCIYRINGAHVDSGTLPRIIENLRAKLEAPKIMLDLPGNKIRTMSLSEPIPLIRGEMFELHDYQVNYPDFFSHLKRDDLMLANDSTSLLEVREINGATIKVLSHSDGILQNNKGLHVRGIHQDIPFLFPKDIELIEVTSKEKLDYMAISFVRQAEDIKEAKKVLAKNKNSGTQIFAKVETAKAIENLEHIFKEVDYISLDRGDLSADIGILDLPVAQEHVIDLAKRAGKNIYLATQFLKNMENNPVPLIAEIIDLHRTIKRGVSGIQLSEETALGKYPCECVKLGFDIFNQYFSGKEERPLDLRDELLKL